MGWGKEQNNIKEIRTGKNSFRWRVQEPAVNCVNMAEWEGKTRAENLYHCIHSLDPRWFWWQPLREVKKVEARKLSFISGPALHSIILSIHYSESSFPSHRWLSVWGGRECKFYEFQWRTIVNILFCCNKYLSSICYVSSSMLGVRDTKMNKPQSLPQRGSKYTLGDATTHFNMVSAIGKVYIDDMIIEKMQLLALPRLVRNRGCRDLCILWMGP